MKYMGGKGRIAGELIEVMTKLSPGRSVFVDAFCGGCNLIDKVPSSFRKIANDRNNYLIAMWRGLQSGVDFPKRIEKDFYDKMRGKFNSRGFSDVIGEEDGIIGWTGFMGSFNGRFFDGGYSSHGYNGRDYISEAVANVTSQIPLLADVEFRCGSYSALEIPADSIVYCDIPYKNVKQYAASRDFDYGAFYKWCERLRADGTDVYVSEYEMPEPFRCVWERETKRALNPGKSKAVTERLFLCGS